MRLPLPQFRPIRSPDHIAEVIISSSTEFTAECLEPEDLNFPLVPAFGSWVQVKGEPTIYGIVCHTCTMPIDSVHRATALGMSLEELRQQQPQIFAMLKTETRVAIAGFRQDQKVYQHLPDRPPQIHAAVHTCNSEEICEFTDDLHFFRTLLQATGTPVDQLLGAVLRGVYQIRNCDRAWLVQAGRHLSILLKEDYDRLGAILSQVHI
ncbi:MAG: hypothetical protein SFT94_07350 [Pseudanabaenaceae cyanobacterium bins.68]|nr:hypothetical protein [Pseudanabaenaceae cyanobacterium bins.68]